MGLRQILQGRGNESFPRWLNSPLISEEAKTIILGAPPIRDESRIVVIGTSIEDKVVDLGEVVTEYLKARGITNPTVNLVSLANRFADVFFNLDVEEKREPTLPKGVLIGTHVRGIIPNSGLFYTERVDKELWSGEGKAIKAIEELCARYQVPYINYELDLGVNGMTELKSRLLPLLINDPQNSR